MLSWPGVQLEDDLGHKVLRVRDRQNFRDSWWHVDQGSAVCRLLAHNQRFGQVIRNSQDSANFVAIVRKKLVIFYGSIQ